MKDFGKSQKASRTPCAFYHVKGQSVCQRYHHPKKTLAFIPHMLGIVTINSFKAEIK
jgi:hypothetical protein